MIYWGSDFDSADPAEWLSTEGLQFGMGIFETMKLLRSSQGPFLEDMKEHLSRLRASAQALQIELPLALRSDEAFRGAFESSVIRWLAEGPCDAADPHEPLGVFKLCLIKAGSGSKWWIQIKPYPYSKEQLSAGFDVCMSGVRRSSTAVLTGHKSLNYGENWLARKKAVENCYQEVIFLNEDAFLTEGSATNLFFLKDGIWHTPRLDLGLLPGIMRQRVIDALALKGISVLQGCYGLSDLTSADAVLLTNALVGVVGVKRLEQNAYTNSAEAAALIRELIEISV